MPTSKEKWPDDWPIQQQNPCRTTSLCQPFLETGASVQAVSGSDIYRTRSSTNKCLVLLPGTLSFNTSREDRVIGRLEGASSENPTLKLGDDSSLVTMPGRKLQTKSKFLMLQIFPSKGARSKKQQIVCKSVFSAVTVFGQGVMNHDSSIAESSIVPDGAGAKLWNHYGASARGVDGNIGKKQSTSRQHATVDTMSTEKNAPKTDATNHDPDSLVASSKRSSVSRGLTKATPVDTKSDAVDTTDTESKESRLTSEKASIDGQDSEEEEYIPTPSKITSGSSRRSNRTASLRKRRKEAIVDLYGSDDSAEKISSPASRSKRAQKAAPTLDDDMPVVTQLSQGAADLATGKDEREDEICPPKSRENVDESTENVENENIEIVCSSKDLASNKSSTNFDPSVIESTTENHNVLDLTVSPSKKETVTMPPTTCGKKRRRRTPQKNSGSRRTLDLQDDEFAFLG